MTHLDPARANTINGSEAATVLGESIFENQEDLMFKKLFNIQSEDNKNTLHGKKYEPIALQIFAKRTGAKFLPITYKANEVYPWLGGTVDAIAEMPDGSIVVVEVKCPFVRKIKPGEYPLYYYAQMQMYLEIWSNVIPTIKKLLFVQYKPKTFSPVRKKEQPEVFDIIEIDKDVRYMLQRLPALKEFWDKMYVWRQTAEKYQIACSADLIKSTLRIRKKGREGLESIAKRHWICRFKTSLSSIYVNRSIPYQTPDFLSKQFLGWCLKNDEPLVIIPFYCFCEKCVKESRQRWPLKKHSRNDIH